MSLRPYAALAVWLLLALPLRAQQPVLPAMPVLETPPSPSTDAVGGAGAITPTDEAAAFLLNPAHLGRTAHHVRASMTGRLGSATRIPGLAVDGGAVTLSLGDVHAGPLGTVTVGAGLGGAQMRLASPLPLNDGSYYDAADRYTAFGVGISTHGPIRISGGTTVRTLSSTDGLAAETHRSLRGASFDVGTAVDADLTALFGAPSLGPLRPTVTASAAYAQTHIGGEVRYAGAPLQALPRTATIGWGGTVGLALPLDNGASLPLLHITGTLQADHLLARRISADDYDYAALVGALRPQHVLPGRSSDAVTTRRGARVTFGETVSLAIGTFNGGGFPSTDTRGVEIRLAGLLALTSTLTESRPLNWAARHLDFRLSRATYFADSEEEVALTGISLLVW